MQCFNLKNVNFNYDKYDKSVKNTLSDINLDIEKGKVTAIIGKSGSGKSTLISLLNGINVADSGEILYEGQNIYDKNFKIKNLRFKCSVVFQYPEYQLFSETVLEDVSFGPKNKGLSEKDANEVARRTLKIFGIEHLENESPFVLSGGEKRKVAMAGVLALEPEILILDEPDAGLDSEAKENLYELLMNFNKDKGMTIILITHNLDDVAEYADNVVLISDGKIIKCGKTYDVLSDEKLLSEAELVPPIAIRIKNYLELKGKKIELNDLRFESIEKSLQ